MLDIAWLICAFPLFGFLILLVFGRRLGEPHAGWLATASIFGSFASSVLVYLAMLGLDAEDRVVPKKLFTWIQVNDFTADAGLLVDPLSVTMVMFITGVGMFISMYAIGYMHNDKDFSKFFLYLTLFVFSMLILVLGDNLLLTFLGWEGVGLCSYLLISFWFTDTSNASAGKKAFITNRVGDWGFMLAIFLAFTSFGSIRYTDIADKIAADPNSIAVVTATAITLLLFVGAAGKSAQIPLYIWLPDAMAGPTPVSALIHAATMVTAGVYLMVRVNPIMGIAYDFAPSVIAWVGVGTALFAATAAVAQNDIKKVLAYSTVSQLGYMMLAVGTGAYVAAIFHMVTHAFFKALLFLGSGSVIHALDHEQDMRRYGGLRSLMPVTAATFIVGWLAIAGVPPFSGFWSKDEILLYAWEHNIVMWFAGIVTAVLTAFYMSRVVFMTFYGERATADIAGEHTQLAGEHDNHDKQPCEVSRIMLIPVIVLASGAVLLGAINLPFASGTHFLEHWLEPSLYNNEAYASATTGTKWILALLAAAGSALGIIAARAVYLKRRVASEKFEWAVAAKAWHLDAAVTSFVGGPGHKIFNAVNTFDSVVVDGLVNFTGQAVRSCGGWLRGFQTGLMRFYALLMAVGVVFMLVWFVSRASF